MTPATTIPALRRGAAAAAALGLALLGGPAVAQTLEQRLDEERLLRGLSELRLPEVMAHYLKTHPPADPLQSAAHAIAIERMAMGAAGVSTAERLAHLETILETRQRLIDQQPASPARPIWLAEQAADLFFEMLPTEGAGLTMLCGLPSPQQAERVRRVAAEMNMLARRAETELDRVILALEADAPGDDRLARQQERRRLIDEERDRRLPFLRGTGACLHAEVNVPESPARRELYEVAVDALTPLIAHLEGFLASRARVYGALALERLGRPEEAQRLVQEVLADPSALRPDVFAARSLTAAQIRRSAGAAAALAELERLQADFSGTGELFYVVLVADQRARVLREEAAAAPADRRSAALAAAFRPYVDLLSLSTDVPPEAIEATVFARLRQAAGPDTPLDALPALVTVARADRLAEDDATRGEAIDLYERALARRDASESERAAALFGLGMALHRSGRSSEAIERFLELADRHPRHHRAEQAIEAAAALAAHAYTQRPGDQPARATLQSVLAVLLRRYVNLRSVDRWRYLAGRVALDEGRSDDACGQFALVTRDGGEWLDSQFMIANVRRTAFAKAEEAGERRRLAQETLTAIAPSRQTIQDALQRGQVGGRERDARQYLAHLRVFEAEAHLELGAPQRAVEALVDIESDRDLDGAIVAAALEARIDACQILGNSQDAQREVRRFMTAAPERVPHVVPPMMAAVQRDVEALLELSRDEEASRKAAEELLPLAEALGEWLGGAEGSVEDLTLIRHRLADAYRLAGRFAEALEHYEALLRQQPDALAFVLGKAECLYGLGGEEALGKAMTLYKRIGGAGSATGGAARQAYWLAQLRMLQILDRVGRNAAKIAPRIERLRQEDPAMGGERFLREFNRLQAGAMRDRD